jgi:hypothetical protein
MRIPENRVQEVQNLIGGDGLESVTESKDEIVTESVESVTESKAEPIEDIRRIVERWGELGRGGAGGVLSPMIVLEEAIDVCGQVAAAVVGLIKSEAVMSRHSRGIGAMPTLTPKRRKVRSPERCQRRANRNTVIIPEGRKLHHSQFPAMP